MTHNLRRCPNEISHRMSHNHITHVLFEGVCSTIRYTHVSRKSRPRTAMNTLKRTKIFHIVAIVEFSFRWKTAQSQFTCLNREKALTTEDAEGFEWTVMSVLFFGCKADATHRHFVYNTVYERSIKLRTLPGPLDHTQTHPSTLFDYIETSAFKSIKKPFLFVYFFVFSFIHSFATVA